ncbi:MAG: hypothetical protein ABW250_21215, partial [Pyrinomonadaceae bacterium]
GAGLSLREPLRAASVEYDARVFKKAEPEGGAAATPAGAAGSQAQTGEAVLISMNPFVRLEWVAPETVYAQTAFAHIYRDELVVRYPRWHVLRVSPQAAVLGLLRPTTPERSYSPLWTSTASAKSTSTSTTCAGNCSAQSRG